MASNRVALKNVSNIKRVLQSWQISIGSGNGLAPIKQLAITLTYENNHNPYDLLPRKRPL